MPIVIFLDFLDLYRDTPKWALNSMLEAIKHLALTQLILNLHKSQLVQSATQAFRYHWTLGSFWAPNISKLATFMERTDNKLAQVNQASKYRFVVFFLILTFAELVELQAGAIV